MSRSIAAQRSRQKILAYGLGILGGVLVMLAPHSPEMLISGDGVAYVATAESLTHGRGFYGQVARWHDTDSIAVLSHWPPGYAIALAVPLGLGASKIESTRVVRAVSAVVTIAAVVLLGSLVGGAATAVLAALFVAATPSIVYSHMIGLSEALFLALVSATAYQMVRQPERPLRYGMLAAGALMVRYIGIALTGAVGVWAFLQPGRLSERLRRGALAVAPSIVLQVAWMLFTRQADGTIRNFGVFGSPVGVVRMWIGAMSIWLAPGLTHPIWRVVMKGVFGLIFLAILAGGLLLVIRRYRNAEPEPSQRGARLFAVAALIIVTYAGVYILSRLFADYALDFHRRYLSPVDMLLGIVLAVALTALWVGATVRLRPWLAVVVGVWFAASAAASVGEVRFAAAEEREWIAKFDRSPTLQWVREHGAERPLFTNWAAPIYFFADRPARELPWVFDQDIPRFGEVLDRSGGLLVSFHEKTMRGMLPPELRDAYAEPAALADSLKLRKIAEFRDGAVWESSRASGGSSIP